MIKGFLLKKSSLIDHEVQKLMKADFIKKLEYEAKIKPTNEDFNDYLVGNPLKIDHLSILEVVRSIKNNTKR